MTDKRARLDGLLEKQFRLIKADDRQGYIDNMVEVLRLTGADIAPPKPDKSWAASQLTPLSKVRTDLLGDPQAMAEASPIPRSKGAWLISALHRWC